MTFLHRAAPSAPWAPPHVINILMLLVQKSLMCIFPMLFLLLQSHTRSDPMSSHSQKSILHHCNHCCHGKCGQKAGRPQAQSWNLEGTEKSTPVDTHTHTGLGISHTLGDHRWNSLSSMIWYDPEARKDRDVRSTVRDAGLISAFFSNTLNTDTVTITTIRSRFSKSRCMWCDISGWLYFPLQY